LRRLHPGLSLGTKRFASLDMERKEIDNTLKAEDQKSLLSETKSLLKHSELRAKKSLAQHFLIDRGILKKIVLAAELEPDDIVIEVGPGLGVLTKELAERVRHLIAVELDQNMVDILKRTFGNMPNVTIIHQDVLDTTPEELFKEAGIAPSPDSSVRYKVVANLPYYITSMVLRHFLEASLKPELIVVMVQKEVARLVVSPPGDMSTLSVSVQFYGKPKIIGIVSRGSFYPAPDVDSAILRIDLHPEPLLSQEEDEGFFDIVHAGFSAPRKQIHNAMSQRLSIPREEAVALLEKAGVEPSRRAETLSVAEWVHLYETYRGEKKA
jgi:16S rRNA (adenine1518-N6/adenine1519-N6)-dimethyltransferase